MDTTLDYYADLSYFFGPDADSIQIDKIQYPGRKVVERCAMIRDFGDKTKEVLDIWSRIKGDNLGGRHYYSDFCCRSLDERMDDL